MTIVAFDPGKTTGWAQLHSHTAEVLYVGEVQYRQEVFLLLRSFQSVECFVVEDYKIRSTKHQGGFAHSWVDPTAAKVIGMIDYRGEELEIPIIYQQASIKPMGYKIAGMEYVKGSKKTGVHIKDAIAHGAYYLSKQKGIRRERT